MRAARKRADVDREGVLIWKAPTATSKAVRAVERCNRNGGSAVRAMGGLARGSNETF